MTIESSTAFSIMQYSYSVPLKYTGQTATLQRTMGLDALLDVAQHLGARESSASAGGTGMCMARATCSAQAAWPISRWLRRNREWATLPPRSGFPSVGLFSGLLLDYD